MSLSQGVMLLDKTPQALLDDMGVDLGGRDVGMAEQLLHRAEIGASLEQMAGEGVAEHVRRDPRRLDARAERERLQLLTETLSGEMLRSISRREQPCRSGTAMNLVGGKRSEMIGKPVSELLPGLRYPAYRLLIIGGPAFANEPFHSAFPDGLSRATALTLTR